MGSTTQMRTITHYLPVQPACFLHPQLTLDHTPAARSWFYCLSGVSPRVHVGFVWVLWYPTISQKHFCSRIVDAKMPLSVNEFVQGALWWPGTPNQVHSCLTHSIPGIGSRSPATLTGIKLLMVNEWTNYYIINQFEYQLVSPTTASGTLCLLQVSGTFLGGWRHFLNCCFEDESTV